MLVGDVSRQYFIEKGLGVFAGEAEAAHVGDVEEAAAVASLIVFVDDRAIEKGHFPAGEIYHLGFCGNVKIVERRSDHDK
jgi:hypothetical protein